MLGASPDRSLTPKAAGAPAGISCWTLTRAPHFYHSLTPQGSVPPGQHGSPRSVSPAVPGAYAVVLLLSCCRLRLLAPHGQNLKCCCWVWGLGVFPSP